MILATEPSHASVPVELVQALEVTTSGTDGDEGKKRSRKRKVKDEYEDAASDEIAVLVDKKKRTEKQAIEKLGGVSDDAAIPFNGIQA